MRILKEKLKNSCLERRHIIKKYIKNKGIPNIIPFQCLRSGSVYYDKNEKGAIIRKNSLKNPKKNNYRWVF